MLKKYYKLLLCFILLLCISLSAFACGKDSADNSLQPSSSVDASDNSADASHDSADGKIEAVIENEPEGYVSPKIDFVKNKFVQPELTNEEMYTVVFEKHSEKAVADEKGNYPDPDYEKGEAYFAYTDGTVFDVVYKCSGISSDIKLSDEFSSFKIITDEISSFARSAAPVNNFYWHKYFTVMLDNLVFTVAGSDEPDYTVFAYVYDNRTADEKTYMICSDGYARTKTTDGVVSVSDKKVDAPKIYMVATLFEHINKTVYINTVAEIPLTDEKVTFHHMGKTATIKKSDAEKLGYVADRSYDITKTLVNEGFIHSDDIYYIELGNSKYYVIDTDNNFYYVWNNSYHVKITGGYVLVQYQNVRAFKDVFDCSKISDLFK